MSPSASCRVAVIGTGAAGLTAIKALRDVGADVIAYDKGDRPGGLWVNNSSSGISPAYDSLHLNTSKGRTEFADYPMPEEWPDYPSVDHVAGYLADYAQEFGLLDCIRFGTTVTSVERDDGDGSWTVESESGEAERFDAVVVANGHNWSPRWPSPPYPGNFDGVELHAHDYSNQEAFRDRRVLIVGMGNSAMDIAVDASFVSRGPVLLSARRGVHIVPKYLFGRPADATGGAIAFLPWRLRQSLAQTMLRLGVGKPQSYGLPAPAVGLFQNHPTISDTIMHRLTHGEVESRPGIERMEGGSVRFTDGRADEVDVIVWATGYEVTIPFLSERWIGPDAEKLPCTAASFTWTIRPSPSSVSCSRRVRRCRSSSSSRSSSLPSWPVSTRSRIARSKSGPWRRPSRLPPSAGARVARRCGSTSTASSPSFHAK